MAPDHRRRGLAGRLLAAAEDRLASLGAVRLQAIVVGSDPRAAGFWRDSHWHEQSDRLRFTGGYPSPAWFDDHRRFGVLQAPETTVIM